MSRQSSRNCCKTVFNKDHRQKKDKFIGVRNRASIAVYLALKCSKTYDQRIRPQCANLERLKAYVGFEQDWIRSVVQISKQQAITYNLYSADQRCRWLSFSQCWKWLQLFLKIESFLFRYMKGFYVKISSWNLRRSRDLWKNHYLLMWNFPENDYM